MDIYDEYKMREINRGVPFEEAEKDADAMRKHDATEAIPWSYEQQRQEKMLARDAEWKTKLDGIPVEGAKPAIK